MMATLPLAWRNDETDVSAEQKQAKRQSRLPQAHEHGEWAEGPEPAPSEGAAPPDTVGPLDAEGWGLDSSKPPSAARRTCDRGRVDSLRGSGAEWARAAYPGFRTSRRDRGDPEPYSEGRTRRAWTRARRRRHGPVTPGAERRERAAPTPGARRPRGASPLAARCPRATRDGRKDNPWVTSGQ